MELMRNWCATTDDLAGLFENTNPITFRAAIYYPENGSSARMLLAKPLGFAPPPEHGCSWADLPPLNGLFFNDPRLAKAIEDQISRLNVCHTDIMTRLGKPVIEAYLIRTLLDHLKKKKNQVVLTPKQQNLLEEICAENCLKIRLASVNTLHWLPCEWQSEGKNPGEEALKHFKKRRLGLRLSYDQIAARLKQRGILATARSVSQMERGIVPDHNVGVLATALDELHIYINALAGKPIVALPEQTTTKTLKDLIALRLTNAPFTIQDYCARAGLARQTWHKIQTTDFNLQDPHIRRLCMSMGIFPPETQMTEAEFLAFHILKACEYKGLTERDCCAQLACSADRCNAILYGEAQDKAEMLLLLAKWLLTSQVIFVLKTCGQKRLSSEDCCTHLSCSPNKLNEIFYGCKPENAPLLSSLTTWLLPPKTVMTYAQTPDQEKSVWLKAILERMQTLGFDVNTVANLLEISNQKWEQIQSGYFLWADPIIRQLAIWLRCYNRILVQLLLEFYLGNEKQFREDTLLGPQELHPGQVLRFYAGPGKSPLPKTIIEQRIGLLRKWVRQSGINSADIRWLEQNGGNPQNLRQAPKGHIFYLFAAGDYASAALYCYHNLILPDHFCEQYRQWVQEVFCVSLASTPIALPGRPFDLHYTPNKLKQWIAFVRG